MNIIETTHSIDGIHSRQLDTAAMPPDFKDRMLTAAFQLALLIGSCAVLPCVEGDDETDEALDTLSNLAEEAMRRFGTPRAVDPTDLLRLASEPRFNEGH